MIRKLIMTPWRQYSRHKTATKLKKDRNGNPVQFKLSFEEWLTIWEDSGHFHERGCRAGEYVMSRFNDEGDYELGNVFIQLHSENVRQGNKGRKQTDEQVRKRVISRRETLLSQGRTV